MAQRRATRRASDDADELEPSRPDERDLSDEALEDDEEEPFGEDDEEDDEEEPIGEDDEPEASEEDELPSADGRRARSRRPARRDPRPARRDPRPSRRDPRPARRGSRPARGDEPTLTVREAAEAALREIAELTAKQIEGITGIERTDDGWSIDVEVVEDRRIPSSTDLLATYETTINEDGELMSYRRVRRYTRGRGENGEGS